MISKITIKVWFVIRRCWVQKLTYSPKYNTFYLNSWINKIILKKKQSKAVQGMSGACRGWQEITGCTGDDRDDRERKGIFKRTEVFKASSVIIGLSHSFMLLRQQEKSNGFNQQQKKEFGHINLISCSSSVCSYFNKNHTI